VKRQKVKRQKEKKRKDKGKEKNHSLPQVYLLYEVASLFLSAIDALGGCVCRHCSCGDGDYCINC
jgi:hypothetical protein